MIFKYKILCRTCGRDMYWLLDKSAEPPKKCPVSDSHEVDLSSVAATDIVSIQEVTTQYEKDLYWLKLASSEATVNDDGVACIEVSVPAGGRYLDECRIWFSDPDDGDRVKRIELVLPDGSVAGGYHEDMLDDFYHGARIPKQVGYVDVSRMSGYGFVPEGVKLRVYGRRVVGGNGKMYANLKWGKLYIKS